jgi:polysaccharide deacetylase family protein (PEP-CTERM system associated)
VITNALSVDVEEYYHGIEFEAAVPPDQRESLPSRVEESVERVLALLGAHGVHATFFTVGQVAKAHPQMIREINSQGHEVACHGYRHDLVSRQSPDEFRADVRRAKAVLEDLSGRPVIGYRAPNYSIGRAQAWAYDILLEEGFRYDSSIYPILHDRYGYPNAPRFPYEIRRTGPRRLIQFPIGTARLLGVNFPIGGGGYFRLLPLALIRCGIQHVNTHERQPILFYFHPWELDPDQPCPSMPWHHRFRHYVGLQKEEAKLSRLLQDIRFSTIQDILLDSFPFFYNISARSGKNTQGDSSPGPKRV